MSAAGVLAQHRKLWRDAIAKCSGCDWSGFGNLTRTDLAHAEHQLDALKAAGYAVVELPNQCKVPDEWPGCLGAWSTTSAVEPVSAWPKRRVVTPDDTGLAVADARSLAAALLAAADAADYTETQP